AMEALSAARTRTVTPDPARRLVSREEFVAAHWHADARPPGHGFRPGADAYYRHDHGQFTLLVLDTVDEHGGWDGSLDEPQLAWLAAELAAADADRRYVVLASHHPLATLINDIGAVGAPRRILADEVDGLLARHRCVIA